MNLVFAALWQKNANKLYSDLAVKSGKISIPPAEFVSYLEIGVRSELASSLLWVTALWSIKISFLLFFRDLGKHIRRQMMLWYCVLGYTVASYITCLGLADYGCVAAKQGLGKFISSIKERQLIRVPQRNVGVDMPLIFHLPISG